MANTQMQILLCLGAWVVVLIQARAIRWREAIKDNTIELKIWFMMLFVAIAITGVTDFSDTFDAYTINNLSRLIVYSSFPLAINFGVTASAEAVGKSEDKRLVRRLWLWLGISFAIMGIIYLLFLSRMPQIVYYTTPETLPEALFKFLALFFEIIATVFVAKMYIAYLPLETSAATRLRIIIILGSTFAVGIQALFVIVVIGGYFWPILALSMINSLSSIFAAVSIILSVLALSHNKLYVKFVLLFQRIQHWYAFQDLQYLIERMKSLFPVIGLPPGKPNFFQFVRDPERYLYPAIILILDGRAMLDDFLAEIGDVPPPPQPWEVAEGTDLVGEALEVQWALQFVQPPDDFYAMVDAYRRASRELLKSPCKGLRTQGAG